MRMTTIKAKQEKIRKLINGCNDEEKLDDLLTLMEYVANSSSEEVAWFRRMSKCKGFSFKLFAQRLREAAEVTA